MLKSNVFNLQVTVLGNNKEEFLSQNKVYPYGCVLKEYKDKTKDNSSLNYKVGDGISYYSELEYLSMDKVEFLETILRLNKRKYKKQKQNLKKEG